MKKEIQQGDWKYKIKSILLRCFDNDKYLWLKAHEEFLFLLQQVKEEALAEQVKAIEGGKYKIVADLARKLEEHPAQLRIKDANHQEYLSMRPDEIKELLNQTLSQVLSISKK